MTPKEALEHGVRLQRILTSLIEDAVAGHVHQLIQAENAQVVENIFIPLKRAAHECGRSVRTIRRWRDEHPKYFRQDDRGRWEVDAVGLRRAVRAARAPLVPSETPPMST